MVSLALRAIVYVTREAEVEGVVPFASRACHERLPPQPCPRSRQSLERALAAREAEGHGRRHRGEEMVHEPGAAPKVMTPDEAAAGQPRARKRGAKQESWG